ncbi:MAG TPA: hypothetical protein DCP92_04985 [Nitrospiraceae bacterium]|jgi:hypothetical protein|nr:hypothetical protein [Nitrospiraceae bacterium]
MGGSRILIDRISLQLEREDEQEDADLGQLLAANAEVVNISRGGMSVECTRKLREDKVYAAKIFLRSAVFHVRCRVVWTLDDGFGHRFRSGVKFVQINHNAADELTSYLQECTVDSGGKLSLRMNATRTRVLFNEV